MESEVLYENYDDFDKLAKPKKTFNIHLINSRRRKLDFNDPNSSDDESLKKQKLCESNVDDLKLEAMEFETNLPDEISDDDVILEALEEIFETILTDNCPEDSENDSFVGNLSEEVRIKIEKYGKFMEDLISQGKTVNANVPYHWSSYTSASHKEVVFYNIVRLSHIDLQEKGTYTWQKQVSI